MKRFFTILLCVCMLLSLVPVGVIAAEEAEQNRSALELFGFPLDPDSYDKNALKPGVYPVSPQYDLYVDYTSATKKYVGQKVGVNVLGISSYTTALSMESGFNNRENAVYFATAGFSALGNGIEDHIAKVSFKSDGNSNDFGRVGKEIVLSIYDAKGTALVTNHTTGGWVESTESIEMWEVEGLLSVTAGDFDGDGVDEIAVYTPNNAAETSSGSTHANIYLGIFEFDANSKTVTTKQYIDLTSKSKSSEICEWEYSHNNGSKKFYCIPYVALSANDLNKDNIDDLSAVVSFSTWFRGAGGYDTYSTSKILDHNTNFASVLESYEGRQGGNLEQVIKHRVLVTDGLGDEGKTKYRYILRNANITVGDVTQEGSREIIIAGNYTRATVENTTNTSKKVNANRFVEVDSEHALCHIVGYTTYENLKNHNTYDKNADYHWTVRDPGNGLTYWYNEDNTDSGPITLSLCAFKFRGTGNPDTIFVGGQLFDYDAETSALKFTSDCSGDVTKDSEGSSVVWIGKSVAGKMRADSFGREMLIFPFYYKVSGKNMFNCKFLTYCEAAASGSKGGSVTGSLNGEFVFEDISTQRLTALTLLDGGGKSSYITYAGNDTEVYYSDVEALAIMQAPPLYEELNDDSYIGNSVTGFAKSEGSGSGTTKGGTFSLGVVAGFEYEASFLGLIPCAGAEYEFSIVGSLTKEHSVEKTYTYTTGFEASGVTDAVTVFTVPYVRYNCMMYMPEYDLPSESNYNLMCGLRDELTQNLEKFVQTGEEQTKGKYNKGCVYYENKYSSYVSEENYQNQLHVLQKVSEEIDFIEKAIASFGKGGTANWDDTVKGALLPYHYNVPQTPMLTTVDVSTYDAIADFTPGLDKIYGNVFDENYRAGDPTTYASKPEELNTFDDKVLTAKNSGTSTGGFLTNTSVSSAGASQSQVIAVEEADSSSIGWGVAVENTSVAKVSIAKVGFTLSAEHNSSYVTTTTNGQEYSGTVVSLPANTPADYSYDWKLVAYNAKLNGVKVPVVGYLTKTNVTPPPSVAQNIEVSDITDHSATLTWEQGGREASYYKLFMKYAVNGKEQELEIGSGITSDQNGVCSYTATGLEPLFPYSYIIKSYDANGKSSVASEEINLTTLPKNFKTTLSVSGLTSDVVYQKGTAVNLKSVITGNEGYQTFYQWQLDKGDGWEDIDSWNQRTVSFDMSPLMNGYRIRCIAIVMLGAGTSYVVNSNPITLRCTNACDNYIVDWDSDRSKVTVTLREEAKASDIMLAVYNNGVLQTCMMGDCNNNTFDLSSYADKGCTIRVMVWDDELKPMGYVFERMDNPSFTVDWGETTVTVNLKDEARDADIYVAAYKNNVMKASMMGDYGNNELDISDYLQKGYQVKVFVWDADMNPLGFAAER